MINGNCSQTASSLRTAADELAARNWAANLRALRERQGDVVEIVESLPAGVQWVHGRDGALTAMTGDNGWFGGCSLPLRAARALLKTLDLRGTVGCFLSPEHAAQIRVALQSATKEHGIIALIPDLHTLRILLACDDFSTEIQDHRLYIAAGERWAEQLTFLLDEHAGLPIPSQFIRTALSNDDVANAMIDAAQRVFTAVTSRRVVQVKALREGWESRGASTRPASAACARICIVTPSHFRLWDDAGHALAEAAGGSSMIDTIRFDPDDPLSSSPLALAQSVTQCDAIISANAGRADQPDILPRSMPWITWVTIPRIAPAQKSGERDVLLLADPAWCSAARQLGWKENQIAVAMWPAFAPPAPPPAPALGIILDTRPIEPAGDMHLSSHRLLWDAIRDEITRQPLALGDDPHHYLTERMRQLSIGEEGLDRLMFIQRLILPAYSQSIAVLLISHNLPLRLFGEGWDQIAPFQKHHAGPVHSRDQFRAAVAACSVLVHAWPNQGTHAIDFLGRPVLRPAGRASEISTKEAARLLTAKQSPVAAPASAISASLIADILART